MAIFAGISQAFVTNNAQSALSQLREALQRCTEIRQWLAAYSSSDLVALGFSSADASAILSAFADADGLNQVYLTGTDSRDPGAGYVYANSQRVIIGPLS